MWYDLEYVPDIKEFYDGFEYQLEEELIDEDGHAYFERVSKIFSYEDKVTKTGSCYRVNGYPIGLHITVKYLDKEDIESLGFKYTDCYRDGGTTLFKYKEHTLAFYGTNSFKCSDKIIISGIIRDRLEVLFNGDIKNKSELITLLKQLNIK